MSNSKISAAISYLNEPAKGYAACIQIPPTAMPNRRRQFVYTIWAVPFWNKLPAEIVNASLVTSFKALLDAHWQSVFPEVPV